MQKVEINFSLWILSQHSKINTASILEILRMRRKGAWIFLHHPVIRNLGVKSGFIKFGIVKLLHATFHEQLSISEKLWYNLLLRVENREQRIQEEKKLFWRMERYEVAGHGLAIHYKQESVKIFKEFHLPTIREYLPVSLEYVARKLS